jgi:hypothetical protein
MDSTDRKERKIERLKIAGQRSFVSLNLNRLMKNLVEG